jgi:hypothetical protein
MRGLELAKDFGLSSEPSGCAGLGFLAQSGSVDSPTIDPDATILLVNTGNGIDGLARMP